MARLPREKSHFASQNRAASRLGKFTIFALLLLQFGHLVPAREESIPAQDYEREELGINRYTAPSMERVFDQLDHLKPLPFDRVSRPLPPSSPAQREQKGLLFGGLIADGFLIVEAERANAVADLGRVLIREARGLGVAERVIRHSASLTELGRAGKWKEVRQELIATQAEVERALVQLRDQKMAHLISLGGWLRGLEISAAAVDAQYTPDRARLLLQPELAQYFVEELETLPPPLQQSPLFQKLSTGVKTIGTELEKAGPGGLQSAEVKAIYESARELNLAIRRTES